MPAVIAVPELIAQAATNLAGIGSTLRAADLTAAGPTQALLPAAADEVSTGVARLFAEFAQDYHRLAGRAAEYHRQFVGQLSAAAGAYAGAETANAASLLAPAASIAAAVPSLDQMFSSLISVLTPLFWQSIALLYYLLFLLLIPIYAALAIYLPFAFLGSILGI